MITCTFENGNKTSLRHAVVDVLVLKGNKILLGKRTGKILEGGKWGFPGGFMERDETLLACVHREVLEETGWEIDNLELLTILDNPNRPHEDRQNVAFVYTAQAVRESGKHDWESDKVKWFELSDLPKPEEVAFDHYDTIQLYLGKK